MSASIDNQTTADFHNSLRYGLTRKREQYHLWQPQEAAADLRHLWRQAYSAIR